MEKGIKAGGHRRKKKGRKSRENGKRGGGKGGTGKGRKRREGGSTTPNLKF